jgi:hypothetical protein
VLFAEIKRIVERSLSRLPEYVLPLRPMAILFECLGCGIVSLIEAEAPRCPQCGRGNGLTQPSPSPKNAAPEQDPSEGKKD